MSCYHVTLSLFIVSITHVKGFACRGEHKNRESKQSVSSSVCLIKTLDLILCHSWWVFCRTFNHICLLGRQMRMIVIALY